LVRGGDTVNEDEKPKPQETQESEAENIEPEDINEPVEDAIVWFERGAPKDSARTEDQH
jgi:hypothetical protein